MTKISCYLRTLRREWGMTQGDLARLVPRGSRRRVSGVERGLTPPNAGEILAYSLLFGLPPAEIFPAFYDATEEYVIERSYALDDRLHEEGGSTASHTRKLLRAALARATGRAHNPLRV